MNRYALIFRRLLILLICAAALEGGKARAVGSAQSRVPDKSPASLRSKTSLNLRASVYYGDQDEEAVPVAGNFYLLDENLVRILQTIHLQPIFPTAQNTQS